MKRSQRCGRLQVSFGKRLRAARITAGWDDAGGFSRDLGIEDQRYRKYERGESVPPLDVLEDIIKLTSTNLDWLLLGRKDHRGAE